jgi:enterochelin esterase-like enzyme
MSLIGTPFLALSIVLAIALTLGTIAAWDRLRGPAALRSGLRLALLLVAEATAVLVVLVSINDSYLLYDSWRDLAGGTGATRLEQGAGGVGARALTVRADDPGHPDFRPAGGGLLSADPVGARSGIRGNLYVWLPPEYDQPQHRGERFPVVELLPGQPGSPMAWFDAMHGQDELAALVRAGEARPMILVAAKSNTMGGDDAGCADLPGSAGLRTATWLGQDVPEIIGSEFRASADPYDWSLMGYSAGGYCAANLAVHYPQVFHSAVSISGYNDPVAPVVRARPGLAAANDPLLVLRGADPQPDIALLLTGSREDGTTVADARSLLAALRAPATGDLLTVARGGHTMDVWVAMLPDSFRWISRHLR